MLNHIIDTSGDIRFVWRLYYKIIGNANMLIANIDEAEGPQEDKNIIKGQALAYRVQTHHQLVQLFAECYNKSGHNKGARPKTVTFLY